MRLIFVSFLMVLLVGCATPYQKTGATAGFSKTQMSENTFCVQFNGNQLKRPEHAEDFALLHSADIALEHEFLYFLIRDSSNGIESAADTTPITTHTTGNAYKTHHLGKEC